MKRLKLLLSAVLMLFCASVQAEEITEDFESVTVDNSTTFSNGWVVVNGTISSYGNYTIWNKGANQSSHSLGGGLGGGKSNAGTVVIPETLSGTLSFYARYDSNDFSSGTVIIYEMTKTETSYTIKSTIATKNLTSSWKEYTVDLGEDGKYIGINILKGGIDDVTYNTAGAPHETHEYASEWTSDETGHWHACTAEGYCNAPKADFAEHDGLVCGVCGYKVPGIDSFPWTENFNSLTSGIPAGWDNSEGTTTDSYKWTSTSGGHDGKCVRFDSFNNGSDKTNTLATPLLYIPESGKFQLKFWCKNPKGGNYSVQIGEYGSEERTTVLDNLINIANWTEQTVDLSAYAGKAIKVYFCGTSNWGSGDAYLYLDDVTVKELIAHTHDYATEWSTDKTNHWHVCLSEVGDCNVPISDMAAHSFDENDVCAVCGYELKYFVDFENGIPKDWENNGFTVENNPSYGNGTKMAYAGRYADDNTLTTPYLIAKKDEVISLEALLPWDDETLKMEYSTDDGETWTLAFSETPAVNNTLCTLTWTAPADGLYKLRFSGRYNYIDNVCGFRNANLMDLKESELTITAANQWGTLCYPNEVEVPAGAQAYTATDVVDGVIELAEVEGTIPANTPVLIYAEEGATLTLPAVKHVTSLAEPVKADGNLFVGCTGAFTLNQNNQYVLQKQNDEVAFYRVNPEKPITTVAYRCYLETVSTESGAKIGISFDDATGISEVKTENSNSIYDLSGRKVEKMQKGVIYIINNHKVIVK